MFCVNLNVNFVFDSQGVESNARSSPARAAQRGEGIAKLEHHDTKDEGYLSHDEPVQHGRVEKVPHRRVLGTRRRSRDRAKLPDGRIGRYTCTDISLKDRRTLCAPLKEKERERLFARCIAVS